MKESFQNLADRFMEVVMRGAAGWIVAVSFALTALAAWGVATQWNISSDLKSLLGEETPAARAADEMQARIGSSTSLFVVVDSPDTEANLEFAERFAERLRALPEVSLAHFHNDKTFFENHLLLYFDRETLAEMHEEFERKIEEEKKKANPLFVSLDSEEDDGENGDGGGEDDEQSFSERLSEKSEQFKHAQFKEYLLSEDRYAVTIIVRFQNASKDLVGTNELLKKVKRLGRRLEPTTYHSKMKLQYGGGLVKRKEQYSSIVDDVQVSAFFTVFGIVLLISLYFRRFRAVAFVLTPLLMGATWALAVAFTAIGQLTTISVFIFAILLGLGIDYGIHLLSSFDERFSEGMEPLDALRGAFGETGRATAVGAITTLTTFFILAFADSRGLSEFGVVAGMGVLFTLIAMFVVLPAMIVAWDRSERTGETDFFLSSGSRIERIQTPPWFRRRAVPGGIVFAVVFTVGAGFAIPRIEFERNIHQVGDLLPPWGGEAEPSSDGESSEPPERVTQAQSAAESVAAHVDRRALAIRKSVAPDSFRREREQTSVGEKYTSAVSKQISSVPTVLMFDSKSEARRVHHYFEKKLDAGELETIRAVNSIHAFMPGSASDQKSRLEEIRKLRDLHESEDLSVLEEDLRDQIERFEPSLDVEKPIDIYDLPGWTKRLYREAGPSAKPASEGEEFAFEYVLFVTSRIDMNVGSEASHFLRELRSAREATGAQYRIASPASVYVATLNQLRYEGFRLILVALVVIVFFLIAVFGSVRQGLVASIPLLFGLLWLVGLAYVVGIRFDMFNVVIIPAIIGIGVDDGIHFYSRYLELGRGSLWKTLQTVGSTIVMTSLTSMVGFGGLALADYNGVRSIGHLAVTGILTALVATLLLLPAVITAAEKFGWTSVLPEE